jgi:hypothetical protein
MAPKGRPNASLFDVLGPRLSRLRRSEPRWDQFAAILLEIGGELISTTYEAHLDDLLIEGKLWRGAMSTGPMPADARPMVGWALKDGVWRQHVWSVRGRMLYEPTDRECQAYYGVEA